MSLPNLWKKLKMVNYLYLPANRSSVFLAAAYAIVVRGSEYDLPPERLDDIVVLSVSSFSGRDRQHKRADKGGNEDDDET